MDQPKMTDKCDTPACQHSFAIHYQSYDGKKTGCANFEDTQRDGGPCYCKGFTRIYIFSKETIPTLPPHPPGAR